MMPFSRGYFLRRRRLFFDAAAFICRYAIWCRHRPDDYAAAHDFAAVSLGFALASFHWCFAMLRYFLIALFSMPQLIFHFHYFHYCWCYFIAIIYHWVIDYCFALLPIAACWFRHYFHLRFLFHWYFSIFSADDAIISLLLSFYVLIIISLRQLCRWYLRFHIISPIRWFTPLSFHYFHYFIIDASPFSLAFFISPLPLSFISSLPPLRYFADIFMPIATYFDIFAMLMMLIAVAIAIFADAYFADCRYWLIDIFIRFSITFLFSLLITFIRLFHYFHFLITFIIPCRHWGCIRQLMLWLLRHRWCHYCCRVISAISLAIAAIADATQLFSFLSDIIIIRFILAFSWWWCHYAARFLLIITMPLPLVTLILIIAFSFFIDIFLSFAISRWCIAADAADMLSLYSFRFRFAFLWWYYFD